MTGKLTACRAILFLVTFFIFAAHFDPLRIVHADEGPILFVIPINVAMFSKNASITVRIFNAGQLAVLEKTSNCVTSYNTQTKTQETRCPEGIHYEAVVPDKFVFPVEGLVADIRVKSDTIKVGEKYRMLISGLSKDNCNATSASITGVATVNTIFLENLTWYTTDMACMGMNP